MKKILGLTAVSVLALACANVQAADLQVTGSIVPGSCSLNIPTLAVDYGRLTVTDLSPVDYTALQKLTTTFSIACDGPTLVGLTAADNRAASRKHEAMVAIDPGLADPRNSFGLGTNTEGGKIGAYSLHVRNYSVDGSTDFRTILNGGGNWSGASDLFRSTPNYVLSWSPNGANSPHLLTTVTGELEVQAAINNTTELALLEQVDIDGSATMELTYI
ncbi:MULTISPECIES: DUF1120 domain-containing protein [Pseudomonas]|uniref:DUF1120 domain-containing protein n=1 Tax=Pseudomonas kilonensis TaxID=132476 RepID=A0ABY0YVA6_9PSED|nr:MULTISPECIES: DUF1120 domain-containing protein [Pseudomonas]EPJ82140.1 hypothetical protein CFII68_18320 [Pseudomonas sp. CFII68]SEE01471.1 Protein of unknown function [Pseudomonas kilonensis]